MSTEVAAPVHTVTLADGSQINDQMSPTERYNAIAKSIGGQPAARPFGITFGPDGHPPLGNDNAGPVPTQAAKAPPPSRPDALPASAPAAGVVADAITLDTLNKNYRKAYAAASTEAQRAAIREVYHREMVEVMEGRKLGETSAQFKARQAGTAPAAPTVTPATELDKPADIAEVLEELADKIKDGHVLVDELDKWHTSGYIMPPTSDGMTLSVAGLELLAQARAAGVPQSQVTAILNAQMRGVT